MRRGLILTTLALLLLAVMGIILARESAIGTARSALTESTIRETTAATIGEPTATSVRQGTDAVGGGSAESGKPAAGTVTENSTDPEADDPEVTEEEATRITGETIGKPEGVGRPQGAGGKPVGGGRAEDDEEANAGGAQQKVTLCHKAKKTLMVGAPARDAHLRHGDTRGVCPSAEAKPEAADETLGPGAAQNGDGGGGKQKVKVCHKGKKTLTVGAPAQSAHFRHGDTRGPCPGK